MGVSYKKLYEELRAESSRQTGILGQALQAAIEGEVRWYVEHGDYRFGVAELDRAHGGLLFIRYAPAGQKPFTRVEFIEDEIAYLQNTVGSEWYKLAASAVYEARAMWQARFEARK